MRLGIAPSATAAAVAEVALRSFLARSCNVHCDRAAHEFLAVEHADGLLSFFSAGHFYKAKAFGSARGAVCNERDGGDGTCRAEVSFQVFFSSSVGQVAHVEFVFHLFSN